MKPDFALSLSFDGICLSLRGPDGWLSVGTVSLQVEDLPAELADLRRAALGLKPGGFVTKLVIPDAQIRYLALETGEVDTRTRRRVIRHALDGATPYRVEDLVYDWSADGGTTHVAAVARETLEEAEAFALEHRFNPVCFVAVPQQHGFATEVFFGETASAAEFLPEGAHVERDARPVEITGNAPPLVLQPPTQDAAKAAPEPATPGTETDALPGFRSRRGAPAEIVQKTASHDTPGPAATFVSRRAAPRRLALPAVSLDRPAPQPRAGTEAPEAPAAGRQRAAGIAARPPAPQKDAAAAKTAATSGSADPAKGVVSAATADPAPVQPDAPQAKARAGSQAAGPEAPEAQASAPVTSPPAPPPVRARAPAAPTPEAAARRDMILRRIASLRPGAADDDALDAALPDPAAQPAASRPSMAPSTGPRAAASSLPPLTARRKAPATTLPAERAATTTPDEAARLTRFGERGRVAEPGPKRGRGLALGLTAAVLLGLLGVGAYSAISSVDGIGRLLGERESAAAALPEVERATLPDTSAQTGTDAAAPLPEPEDAAEAAADAPEEPEQIAARSMPEPSPEPEERAATARAPGPDEAAARYAATGIWQMAPERPAPASFQGIADLYVASIDGRVPQPDAVALSQPGTTIDRPPQA
ncbi:MAG: hypothetical protein ACLFP0_12370, partial [Rhodosalinus sp.]